VLRRLMLNSPVSHTGYFIATVTGAAWGAIWSTGRIERRNGLLVFRGMPGWTFGRGGTCVGACYFTNQNASTDVLEHEAVHKVQWQKYGMLFPAMYLKAGRDPMKNRFEIEAGLEQGGYLRRASGRRTTTP
jgi:hypothetical protein